MGQPFQSGFKYLHIAANGTFNLITSLGAGGSNAALPQGSLGLLGGVAVNNPGASWTVTIYDGPGGTGNIVAAITPAQTDVLLDFPLQMLSGLSAVAAGTTPGDMTIAYA
jgi:hypothetical protein